MGDERGTVADDGLGERGDAAVAGHRGDEDTARRLLASADEAVRATALGALARMGHLADEDLRAALADPSPSVRRRAVALAIERPEVAIVALLGDADDDVAEQAAWACGERQPAEAGAVAALVVATEHADALVREAAVAALGAIGDPAGLPAILARTDDKPAVRRRAVLALAPFEGDDVTAALQRALTDRDWQVRQAAEDLLPPPDLA